MEFPALDTVAVGPFFSRRTSRRDIEAPHSPDPLKQSIHLDLLPGDVVEHLGLQ